MLRLMSRGFPGSRAVSCCFAAACPSGYSLWELREKMTFGLVVTAAAAAVVVVLVLVVVVVLVVARGPQGLRPPRCR